MSFGSTFRLVEGIGRSTGRVEVGRGFNEMMVELKEKCNVISGGAVKGHSRVGCFLLFLGFVRASQAGSEAREVCLWTRGEFNSTVWAPQSK